MKICFKALSMVLILSMLLSMLPAQVFAAGEKSDTDSTTEIAKLNKEKKEAKIVREVIAKRDKNVKHFLKDDMTYEAVVYPEAIHFKDANGWKEIDNTLVEGFDEDKNSIIENKQNDYKIKIAKNSDASKLVRIQKGKYELSWGVQNIRKTKSEVEKIDELKSEALNDNEKQRIVKNTMSTVNFYNILPNVDLQYQLKSEKVKEFIIINKKIENPVFNFNLQCKNLTAQLKEDKSIVLFDDKDKSKEIFNIQAPFMYDAKGQLNKTITLELTKNKKGYELILKPDITWLNDPERAYPVKIDPCVYSSVLPEDVSDSIIFSDTPTVNSGVHPNMIMSKSLNSVSRSYLAFQLPSLPPSAKVTDSYLSLYLTESINNSVVSIHKVLGSWNENNITWGNAPGYDSKIYDCIVLQNWTGPGYKQYFYNISALAQDWYNNGNNFGIAFQQNTMDGWASFLSSDSTVGDAYRPKAIINYTDCSGLEEYWTYHSQSVGRAGTGYVNDNNGNLIFTHTDLAMNGNRMPVTLQHVYNISDRSTNTGYGLGWRLNLCQTVTQQGSYYIYTDEDGTKHYFNLSNGIDESGLNLSIVKNADNTYTITDKKGNKLNFTSSGYLSNIKDNNDNTLSITYQGTNIKTIVDGAGRTTTLNYVNGYLDNIVDPSNRVITKFQYVNGQLKQITYLDNNYSTYIYDSLNNITDVINYDGYKISYTYAGVSTNRVRRILETNTANVLGQELNIEYGVNASTFTDISGRKNIYHFNTWGNTDIIRDSEGNAQYYSFFRGSNINNKLSLESKLQKSVVNYIKNHNMEFTSDWTIGSSDGSTGTGIFTLDEKYLGNKSLMVTKTNSVGKQFFSQMLTLTKGKTYTLSGFIKTKGIATTNNKGAAILVTYQNNLGVDQTLETQMVNAATDWKRCEVKFTIPQDSASSNVYVKAGIIEGTGDAFFDCLQLEDGPVANRYNLLENPDLTEGTDVPTFWAKNTDCDSGDLLVTSTDVDYVPGLSKKSFKINGSPQKSKKISQIMNIPGKMGDVYVAGGWSKGYSLPLDTDYLRNFALVVKLRRTNGTDQTISIPFNVSCQDWQYISGRISADSDYTSITYEVLYANNANEVYFDGLQLYKDEFGETYQYDSNGNIVSSSDAASQKTQFMYNSNNDLTKLISPKGSTFSYNYDTKHNIKDAASAKNVVYTFSYDSYGNPLTAKVGYGSLFTNTSATYVTDGNYLDTVTDDAGNAIKYSYNTTKGTLDTLTDAKSKVTNYSYDSLDRLEHVYKTVDGQEVRNSYSYENDRLRTITHNGFNYNFDYDSMGKSKGVNIGTQSLINNNYEARTGKLLNSAYGNGQKVGFDYDNQDRITAKKYNDNTRHKYYYDGSGNIGYKEDIVNGVNYRYVYDMANKLKNVSDTQGFATRLEYDPNNNNSRVEETVGNSIYKTDYLYDSDNRPSDMIQGVSMSEIPNVEYFPLNGSLLGNKGSTFTGRNISFDEDEYLNKVLGVYGYGTNLIVDNPSFETSSWGYNYDMNGSTGLLRRITSDSVFGNYSLEFYDSDNLNDGSATAPISIGNMIEKNPDYEMDYTFSVYAKRIGNTQPQLGFKLYDRNMTSLGFTSFNTISIPDERWTRIILSVKIPVGTRYISPVIRADVKDKDVVRFDAAQVESRSFATNYADRDHLDTNVYYEPIVTKNSGTLAVFFNKKIEYANANILALSQRVKLYIDSDYRLKLAIKNSYGNFVNVISSSETIDRNKWYFTGFKWSLNGASLNCTMFLNDKVYTGSISGFQDFTDDNIYLGSEGADSASLNGLFKQFMYSTDALDNSLLQSIYKSSTGYKLNYSYDILGRLEQQKLYTGLKEYKTSYGYAPGKNGSTTSRLSNINNSGKQIVYTYDTNGNIDTITEGSKNVKYYYNELNEMIREDRQLPSEWVSKTNMLTARYGLEVVPVNGKLYAIGGYDSTGISNKVEEYDPSTDTWTVKANMPTLRECFGATAINGKIYVLGGSNASGYLRVVEEYNPQTNTWTTKTNLPTPRTYAKAAVANGKIYVVGGYSGGYLGTVEEYDPIANTWSTKANMPTARYNVSLTSVNNKIYAIGGQNNSGYLSAVEEYSPTTNTWSVKTSMITARNSLCAADVNGKIYAIGGQGVGSNYLNNVEVYDTSTNTWSTTTSMNSGRNNLGAATVNNKIYVIGGYSSLGRLSLVEEFNPIPDPTNNKTIVYSYDAGGNITNKTEYNYTTASTPTNPIRTYNYAYDLTWKDKLTSYDGKTITYDSIGNPLTYNGWTYTWEEGRQLATINGNGYNLSFKYNDSGIRTQKVVNGVTTQYHLVGDVVTYETNGTDKIYYTYDASNKLISMNLNGTEYFYIRNGQGDIIGLFDINGIQVVSYSYDTWGKLNSITGTLASTVGVKNPYRYRGYRYDSETGLYYLQSRYYNPEWGRFLNLDGIIGQGGELLSHNMFAYCKNNPVILVDPTGFTDTVGEIYDFGKYIVSYVISTGAAGFEGMRLLSPAGAFIGVIWFNPVETISSEKEQELMLEILRRDGIITLAAPEHFTTMEEAQEILRVSQTSKMPNISLAGRVPGVDAIPNMKKQGREKLEKKKQNKRYKGNPNKRPKDLNKHTPARDHQKYPQ